LIVDKSTQLIQLPLDYALHFFDGTLVVS